MKNISTNLREKLPLKNARPKFFSDELKNEIENFGIKYSYPNTKNLDRDKKLALWFRYMKSGIEDVGVCTYENCGKPNRIVNDNKTGHFKISVGCCVNHSVKISMLEKYGVENAMDLDSTKEKMKATCIEKYGVEYATQSKDMQDKMKATNLERYGVENIFQSEEGKAKIKETNLERYGVENPSQSDEIKQKKIETVLKHYGVENQMQSKIVQDKMKATNLERYGFEYASQSITIRNKVKATMLERYGVENPSQSNEIQQKKIETTLKNYGVENPNQSEIVKQKSKETCIKKYGVEHPMQDATIFERAQKNAFKQKTYIWKTGEISLLQGYEPIVLKELEDAGYTYDQIKTNAVDMPYIEYFFEDKKHIYFPDFFIPSENRIIEVKSKYTLEKEWDQNQQKFNAVKSNGFNFDLEVR